MQVIPVINCSNFECVKKKLAVISEIGSEWAHIDVSDGKFASVKTSFNLKELITNYPARLASQGEAGGQLPITNFSFEVHLMVEYPEEVVEDWLKAGAKRIIVHVESIRDREEKLSLIFEKCSERGVEVMLAINPETPVDKLIPFLDELLFVQILAVPPGPSGQKFGETAIEKIRFLRERAPEITIEIDGGINPETAKLARDAGVDIITSGSYIFESKNPRKAYEDLKAVFNPIL